MKTLCSRLIPSLLILLCVGAFAAPAHADTYTYSTIVTDGQAIAYSDPLPVSGWIDKIEVVTDVASTTTVTVATYSAGNQAIDTYYTRVISATTTNGTAVCRPRVIGTDNGATNLAAVISASGAAVTNIATTYLTGAYEHPFIGGNVKCAVTGTKNDGSCPVVVTIFFEPIKH